MLGWVLRDIVFPSYKYTKSPICPRIPHLWHCADGRQCLSPKAVGLQAFQILVAGDLGGVVPHSHRRGIFCTDSTAVIPHLYAIQSVVLLQRTQHARKRHLQQRGRHSKVIVSSTQRALPKTLVQIQRMSASTVPKPDGPREYHPVFRQIYAAWQLQVKIRAIALFLPWSDL